MRSTILLVFLAGCAHVSPRQGSAFETLSDAEVAKLAVKEALGELHQVVAVDADGVAQGRAAFGSREARLEFEARVDALVRARVYGQGPTLHLIHLACEAQQRAGWEQWPGDRAANRRACDFGDELITLHSLFKKPALQRAYVELLLRATQDAAFNAQARERLSAQRASGIEPYQLAVEKWDRIEGFRPLQSKGLQSSLTLPMAANTASSPSSSR